METQTLAQMLTGREVGQEIRRDEVTAAREAGLVVVFGASDDLLEFRGAINDEVGAWGGVDVLVTPEGLWESESCQEKCAHYRRAEAQAQQRGVVIQALWDPGEGYSWKIVTTLPHSTFEIVGDGEPYCQGLVFHLASVTAFALGKDC